MTTFLKEKNNFKLKSIVWNMNMLPKTRPKSGRLKEIGVSKDFNLQDE